MNSTARASTAQETEYLEPNMVMLPGEPLYQIISYRYERGDGYHLDDLTEDEQKRWNLLQKVYSVDPKKPSGYDRPNGESMPDKDPFAFLDRQLTRGKIIAGLGSATLMSVAVSCVAHDQMPQAVVTGAIAAAVGYLGLTTKKS